MQYVKPARFRICQAVHRHDRAQSGTMHLGSIYCASVCKDGAGTILPSVEQNWLKLSWNK